MAHLFRRIGNPLEWCAADRCLLAALVCIAFIASYIAAALYYLTHPEIADYVHYPTARLFYHHALVILVGWVIIAAAALFVRRRRPENNTLVLATCLLYAMGFGVSSYLFGVNQTK